MKLLSRSQKKEVQPIAEIPKFDVQVAIKKELWKLVLLVMIIVGIVAYIVWMNTRYANLAF